MLGLFVGAAGLGCGRSEPEMVLAPPNDAGSKRAAPEPEPSAEPDRADRRAAETRADAEEDGAETVLAARDFSHAKAVYERHCAACHGENGKGNGPAARFLYPRPRNFRDGQFRLVSTTNRVPSDADLEQVLERGMPGSAMFPFAHLPEDDRTELVALVRRFMREGVVERVTAEAAEFGEEPTEQELEIALANFAEPGPPIELPAVLDRVETASLERARELYTESCASCHGETGKGDGVEEQFDEFGIAITPRDFTQGIFKGGGSPEELYARIVLGAPGTPMPASPALEPADVSALVRYVLTMSEGADPSRVEHRRRLVSAAFVNETLPDTIPEATWADVEATPIVVSPLWWRSHEPPDLTVQALHDGQTLAVRMTWGDASADDTAVRTEDFPDKVALQLYQGDEEPFLGMGATDAPVELWLWDASADRDQEDFADVEDRYPNMAVDGYPFEEEPEDGPDGLPTGHPAARQAREFITAWEAGNPRSDPTRPLAGSGLQAQGFGSTTAHPIASRHVEGRGSWDNGRWTVVLRRPLEVPAHAGLTLQAGDRLSVGFALFDGAERDRNGQKLVSIWHDLELERRDRDQDPEAPQDGEDQ